MAAVVPAKEPATNLENGGRVLERTAEIASGWLVGLVQYGGILLLFF